MYHLASQIIKVTHLFNVYDAYEWSNYDADIFCFPLNCRGKIEDENDIVFYNNSTNTNKSIYLFGDCLSGCSDCGNDSIAIDLASIPKDIEHIIVISHLYRADERRIDFSHGRNEVIISVLPDLETCIGKEIINRILPSGVDGCETIILCELNRDGNGWIVQFPENIRVELSVEELFKSHGVNINN